MFQKEEKITVKNRKKKLVLFFLIFCLVFLIFPLQTFAADPLASWASTKAECEGMNTGGQLKPGIITVYDSSGTCNAVRKSALERMFDDLKKFLFDKEKGITATLGSKALKRAIHEALVSLAMDTATYIGSGGEGQKPLFIREGWGEYLKNVADNAGGSFIEGIDKKYKLNLCEPSLAVKMRIDLGLVQVERPKKPDCTFNEMLKNWDKELQRKDFLSRFQNMFEPTSSDLGVALSLFTDLTAAKEHAANLGALNLIAKKGWLDVTEPITGKQTSIPLYGEKRAEALQNLYSEKFGEFTGDALADAANVFLNQLAITALNKLLASLGKDKPTYTTPYGGDYGGLGYEAGPAAGGAAAAKEKTRRLFETKFSERGDYNILAELTQCPNPTKAGPTNCVITDRFSQAVSEKLTVGEAMEQGYLNPNGIFGFTADGLEPPYNEGYPYRSMIILRKFRIVPVGWELAAQYIKTNPSSIDGTKNLGDLVACFNPNDDYEGYRGSWCQGLVDPTWVLKAPLNYCKREGPGPEIVSEQIVGAGEDSELAIARNDNYCGDEQSCIKENDDGSCVAYGYCTEERRKWQFDAKTCDLQYNTCQTFRDSDGKTVSYLENTLDWSNCSVDNAGCKWYCQDYDYSAGDWTCDLASGNKLYLDNDAEECDAGSEGCHEFIRTKAGLGANLLPNSSFEAIGATDTIDDGVADTFNSWGSIGEAVSGGYDGTTALKITSDLSQAQEVGPAGYAVSGQTYTLSFYAKDCGTGGSFGLDTNTTSLETSSNWQYFKLTNIYPATAMANEVTIQISGFGASCLVDAIKLEQGNGTPYDDYRQSGLVYEKLVPQYLESACYNNPGVDYTLRTDAPALCSDFVRKCNFDEAGCELYTSQTDGTSIPAKVIAQDYCPAECAGYDVFIQKETVFDSLRDSYFIPSTAKTCGAEAVGCDEFTNLDEVEKGGEGREYYTYLKQCMKPSADCAEFYTWEGSDETGYQLRVFSLERDLTDVDGNGATTDPYITNTGPFKDQFCDEAAYNLSTNPDCREFYNTAGEVFYKFYPYTVTCSDNCKPYRRTENNIDPTKIDQASCGQLCDTAAADGQSYCWDNSQSVCYYCKNGGEWDSGNFACLYDAIPGEGEKCSAAQIGCREYTGNTGNNTMTVLSSNFEGSTQGWIGIGGATIQVTNTALMAGGNSLFVSGAFYRASTTVGRLVSRGNAYVLSFIAKAQASIVNLTLEFNDGASVVPFAGSAALITDEWRIYQLNLAEFNRNASDGESLVITGDGNFYIDDIKLTEITDRYYLVKNSWNTPDVCFEDINGLPVGPLYNLGCDSYRDRENNIHYLHSFNRLCQESAVGCELMIDTYNSSGYESQTFNAGDPSEIAVGADEYIYAVYDQDKECYLEDKGCERLGDAYEYEGNVLFSDIYLKNNPDRYDEILCRDDEVGCQEWTTEEGASYFKEPGDQTCEWRQAVGVAAGSWGWYKKKVKKCDTNGDGAGDGGVCLADSNCSAGQTCQLEGLDSPCPTSAFKTFGFGGTGNEIEQPNVDANGYWAGLCPASQSSCSEYLDPISKFSSNIVFNAGFSQDVDGNGIADGWSAAAAGSQDIALEPSTLYILAVESVNQATVSASLPDLLFELGSDNELFVPAGGDIAVNSTIPGARVSKMFYTLSVIWAGNVTITVADASPPNNSKVEVKKAMVNYQLGKDLDKQSCNGIVNFEDGCVLFNERKQNGLALASLSWDADLTVDDGVGVSPQTGTEAERDANTLIKVSPDRACDQWLACRSMVAVENEDGTKKNVCFDIGLCDNVNENGDCDNFILEARQEQAVILPGDFSQFSNIAGYAKVGYSGVMDYTMMGMYQLGRMEQKGEMVYLPNSNFEFFGDNGYPIGWVWEGGVWDASKFKVIDNPYTAQVEGIGYAPEGRGFLKLGTAASSTSEFADVLGGIDYIVTAYVNTVNLSSGSAKLKVMQFDNSGNFIKEDELINYASGNNWNFQLASFTTAANASRIKIVLYTDSATQGNFYFDDIQIKPALESRADWYTAQSCRLYPEDDALSCEYFDDSGIIRKGWSGYCLEYDRYPGSSDACVLWWPVDRIKGDGITEGGGYLDKMPAYYCLEAKPFCTGGEVGYYCGEVAQTVSAVGQNKFWSGRVYEGTNYEIPFAEDGDGANIKWSSILIEDIVINYSRDDQPFGSIVPPGPENNPYEWDSIANAGADLDIEPIYMSSPVEPLTGARAGTPYYGEDITCRQSWSEQYGNCGTRYCVNRGVWDNCWNGGWNDDCTSEPGTYTQNPDTGEWTSCHTDCCGDDGRILSVTTICETNTEYNIASTKTEAKEGVKRIFAQSYGGWEWIGDQNNGRYIATSGQDWIPPENLCLGGIRPAYPNDYCAITPIVGNVKVNNTAADVELVKTQFINFTFTSDVDSQQLPMTMYAIDWGDNEKTVVTGIEMRDRANPDNPQSLYHLYSYWDLKAKNSVDQDDPATPLNENTVYCGGEAPLYAVNYNGSSSGYQCLGSPCCVMKPKVQIKDNWGWCNGGSFMNDCDQWEEFASWVVVKEK